MWDDEYRDKKFTPSVEFSDFMLDTYLLAHTDGLVAKFTSNLDRLAFELQTGRGTPGGTCVKPFISIDSPWCFDFNTESGVRVPKKVVVQRVTKMDSAEEREEREEEDDPSPGVFWC